SPTEAIALRAGAADASRLSRAPRRTRASASRFACLSRGVGTTTLLLPPAGLTGPEGRPHNAGRPDQGRTGHTSKSPLFRGAPSMHGAPSDPGDQASVARSAAL